MRPLGFAWRRLATVLVVVGLLSGCTVGPNYRRPQVNAGASYQYTRPNSENSPFLNGSRGRSPFTGDDFETSVDLAFELDLWGRLRRATEAARAELLAREENRRAVLITLVSDVARTYFDLLELDQEL